MWAVYAFLSAFFTATIDPIAKRALKNTDEYLVGWMLLSASTFFLAFYCLSHKMPPFSPRLLMTLLAVIPFEILATVLYYRALRLTDISLSVPFLALTPVFVILTALLILGERSGIAGMAGILLIATGVYSLNIKEAKYGWTSPIRAIFMNKGSLYMVLVALIFGLTSTISKKVMLLSSPESAPFIYNLSITIAMAPIVVYRLRNGLSVLNQDRRVVFSYAALGLLSALSSVFYFKAIAFANVAYVISIKRLSLLMSVGYGWLFFKERDIRIRLLGTFCMFLGVALILICK